MSERKSKRRKSICGSSIFMFSFIFVLFIVDLLGSLRFVEHERRDEKHLFEIT